MSRTQTTRSKAIFWPDSSTQNLSTETGRRTILLDAGGRCQRDSYRTTVDLPEWKALVLQGQDASNVYDRFDVVFKPRVSYVHLNSTPTGTSYKRTNVIRLRTSHDVTSNLPDQHDAALQDLALKRLKKRAGDITKQVNLLVPLAELGELRSTIKAIGYASIDMLKALIDIKRSRGASAYKYAAHAWLQFSFAIKPTLAEANEIALAIDAELNKQGGDAYTVRGAAKKDWVSQGTHQHAVNDGNIPIVRTDHHYLSYRYVAGFRTPLRAGNNYSVAKQFGFEMPGLVPVFWELTPFSWVFDYFGTMGDYLEDTFITDPTSSIYCVCTRKYRVTGNFLVKPATGSWVTSSWVEDSANTSYEMSRIFRSSFAQIPSRSLRFKSVDEIGKNTVNKVLNLASVLAGGKAFSNKIK